MCVCERERDRRLSAGVSVYKLTCCFVTNTLGIFALLSDPIISVKTEHLPIFFRWVYTNIYINE